MDYPYVSDDTSLFIIRPLPLSYSDWSPVLLNEDQLIAVLQLSKLWMIDAGVRYAIHNLESSGLAPAHMLGLGQEFSIVDWISPAVTALLAIHLKEISFEDVELIGLIAFDTIMRAREATDSE